MHLLPRDRPRVPRRALLAVCLAAVPAAGLSACGGDSVPSNAVAKVDDAVIEKRTFDRWMRIAAISAQGAGAKGATTPKLSIPQPREFTK